MTTEANHRMNDTISLDLAKRFKEVGIEFKCEKKELYELEELRLKNSTISGGIMIRLYFPTAEELWARLPYIIDGGILFIEKDKNSSKCNYVSLLKYGLKFKPGFEGPTIAEALGEMYLYLYKNGLIGKDD